MPGGQQQSESSVATPSFRRRSFLGALAVSSVGLAGCLGDDDVSLVSADYMADTHPVRDAGIIPFLDQIEEEYDGELEIDDQSGEALGGASEIPDLIQRETASMGVVSPNHAPDLFSLTGVAELPGLFDSTSVGAEALYRLFDPEDEGILYEEELREQNIRPLFVGLWPPYQIFSASDDPIVSLADWDGRSVRSGGGIMDTTISELGGTPVEMASAEIFTSMEQGIIDSSVGPIAAVPALDLDELLQSFSTNLSLGSFVFLYGINNDIYEGLPSDLQELLHDTGREITTSMAEAIDGLNDTLMGQFGDAPDIDAYEVPEDELDEINAVLADVEDIWVDQQGEGAADILAEYRSHLDDI